MGKLETSIMRDPKFHHRIALIESLAIVEKYKMKSSTDRIRALRDDLTDKIGFEPKLADGISEVVCETVLLVYKGVEAAEFRLSEKFAALESEVKKWHNDERLDLDQYFMELKEIERQRTREARESERSKERFQQDLYRKISNDFMQSDELWWRTIVSALSGSAVAMFLTLLFIAILRGAS